MAVPVLVPSAGYRYGQLINVDVLMYGEKKNEATIDSGKKGAQLRGQAADGLNNLYDRVHQLRHDVNRVRAL
jgi:hypothetical protein